MAIQSFRDPRGWRDAAAPDPIRQRLESLDRQLDSLRRSLTVRLEEPRPSPRSSPPQPSASSSVPDPQSLIPTPPPDPQPPPPRISVAIGAIVVDGDQILLVQRGHPPQTGRWTIPGGRVEVGESLAAAVRREMREECGIEVEAEAPAIMLDRIIRDADGALLAHYLIIDFWATPIGDPHPVVTAASDALAAGWFTMEEIRALPTTTNLLDYLEEAFRRRQAGGECLVVHDEPAP